MKNKLCYQPSEYAANYVRANMQNSLALMTLKVVDTNFMQSQVPGLNVKLHVPPHIRTTN